MVPKLKDFLHILEEIAPSYMAYEWDNPGLQVGCLSQEIKKIFISLDPTIKAVRKASTRDAQLLLTHHPLIFKHISCIYQESYPGNVIFESFKKGISIVAAHTNLDMTYCGINDMLANLFALQSVETLQKREDLMIDTVGMGKIGDLLEPMSLADMTESVKVVLGAKRVKVVGEKNSIIRRVAVVGGSGGRTIPMASKKGADLLITGDVTHHEALEAQNAGLALIDGGHFHTEKAALIPFADRLKGTLTEQDWDVTVEVYKDEKNPMRCE